MLYALSVHGLISITISIVLVVLWRRTLVEYLRRSVREVWWIGRYSLREFSPLVSRNLAWASMICGLLLIWTLFCLHAVSCVMQWLRAVPI